jgi:hypothetical protein
MIDTRKVMIEDLRNALELINFLIKKQPIEFGLSKYKNGHTIAFQCGYVSEGLKIIVEKIEGGELHD